MTARRFTDKPDLDPQAVRSLSANHPAMTGNRTLFPTTVVDVDENFEERLLVSGRDNRKLGEKIIKGFFKGYALYSLSLEERATCPVDCSARAFCYGNGVQMARRHRITDEGLFFSFLEDEIREILAAEKTGLMVRLHVLGDFPNVSYVEGWRDLLARYKKLACYGYTHRKAASPIGAAITETKELFPTRFRIRWSADKPGPDSAVIIDRVPYSSRVGEGLVCPAQTDATGCCASCGLCWENAMAKETIVFVKHGPRDLNLVAAATRDKGERRSIEPIALPTSITPAKIEGWLPVIRMAAPTDLKVEASYQRDLSGKSVKLIRKIVAEWSWAKFKPPICAETLDGLFVIDGQHTAIAAASHPEIKEIPVLVVPADQVEQRASAFVAHNRDRLTMTPAQIFYGEVIAGDATAKAILDIVTKAGCSIPRLPVSNQNAQPGQISALGEVQTIFKVHGAGILERVLRVGAKACPLSKTLLRALRTVLTDEAHSYVANLPDRVISDGLASIEDFEYAAEVRAMGTDYSRFTAAAMMIADAARKARKAAA